MSQDLNQMCFPLWLLSFIFSVCLPLYIILSFDIFYYFKKLAAFIILFSDFQSTSFIFFEFVRCMFRKFYSPTPGEGWVQFLKKIQKNFENQPPCPPPNIKEILS